MILTAEIPSSVSTSSPEWSKHSDHLQACPCAHVGQPRGVTKLGNFTRENSAKPRDLPSFVLKAMPTSPSTGMGQVY